MGYIRTMLATLVTSSAIMGHAQASVVFSHSGNSDPTTQGWTVDPSVAPLSGRPTSGAVSNDQGSGFDAWFIDDNLTTLGSNWLYTQSPSANNNNQASSLGWILRARLRIVDAPDDVGNAGSVMLEYANGITDFRLALGSEADGDPIALLWDGGTTNGGTVATGTSFTLQGGSNGYHLYEMIYDPSAASVDLFIDGVERISDYSGISSSLFDRVAWGSGSSFDTGQSNWNQVEFEIAAVPLPASLPLFLTGLAGLAGWAKKTYRR